MAVSEIGSTEATGHFERLRPLKPMLKLVRRFDTSDCVRSEIVRWLLGLPLDLDAAVGAIWPADAAGISITYRDLAHHFDVLWYPSSDDVWIFEPGNDSWLLELNHEEVFTWFARSPAN